LAASKSTEFQGRSHRAAFSFFAQNHGELTMPKLERPIAVYHEHPEWFSRLFAEFDRRGTPYERIDATRHHFDIESNGSRSYSLFFNRMSPSAYTRGHGNGIYYTASYLEHLEKLGARVINGSRSFRYEISKALQLSLLHSLGLPYPRARVINDASLAWRWWAASSFMEFMCTSPAKPSTFALRTSAKLPAESTSIAPVARL